MHSDRTSQAEHRDRYNAPSLNDVAALLVNKKKYNKNIYIIKIIKSSNSKNIARYLDICIYT